MLGDDGSWIARDVVVDRAVDDGGTGDDDVRVVDADGCYVAPGFLDLQRNVAPDRLVDVARQLPATGVTAWLPTVVTSTADVRRRAVEALRSWDGHGARPLGLHLEGPFLSPARVGAHDPALVTAPVDEGWSSADGVALVTLAPEVPGALDLVGALVARGVVVSLGHSEATAAEARAAVDAGARMVTHLFNAMGPLHHRHPGLAGVALTDERLAVGLIADGIHLDPVAVDVAWRAAGERIVLVTDAVDGADRLPDGTLAGSRLTLDQAVRNLVAFTGCSPAAAVAAASIRPARVLGVEPRGVVVLDDTLQVVTAIS